MAIDGHRSQNRNRRGGMNICSIEDCDKPVIARGWCSLHYYRWQRHGNPQPSQMRKSPGTGWLHNKGYIAIGKKLQHVIIAEKALGKELPKGVQVHHVDYDRKNNAPSNLVICPNQEYHALLHVRTDAFLACGNPDYRKCRFCGQYDDAANLSFTSDGERQTPRAFHTKCSREKQAARRAKLKEVAI